ncbi:MAG: hypothetical protein CL824_01560 [Crocinitomicaceae bacterium]|nr:hypothetical protein [Crocinitomicaceae bacterium]
MFDNDEEFSKKNLEKDLILFENHLKGESIGFIDSDRVEMIIDHYLIHSHYQKAKDACDFGLEIFPTNTIFTLRKAQSMTGLGLLSEALKLINELEKLENSNAELFLTKASLLGQLRDTKNAIKYYRLALNECENAEKDEIYVDMAMEYEHNQNFTGAIKVLNEALSHNPHNEFALSELSYCYEKEEKEEEAIHKITQFIDENPYSFSAWYHLGNAYLRSENFDKAIWAFDYSILINDSSAAAHFNIASAYLSIERHNQAIKHFQNSLDLDGEEPMAYCYMGEAYEQLEELELAKNCYLKSIELSPNFAQAWLGLGIIEDLKGNTKEAIVIFNKTIEIEPENSGINHVLASAYEKEKEFKTAIKYYKISLELDPNDMECLSDFLKMLTLVDKKAALNFIQKFNETNGQDIKSWIWEVNLKWINGLKKEALGLFSISCDTDNEKSLFLFDINPVFLEVPEFVSLSKS